jgi:glycosyltransferase involved in cell wall biosynthesis
VPTSRLVVLCDYPEEGWPSMDLAAEILVRELRSGHSDEVKADRVCPLFRSRAARVPGLGRLRFAANADRLLNRLWDYPRYARSRAGEYDVFHICDHSYSQLVHALPPGRVGVMCHDLDTFRCLTEPNVERRPRWFRAMARHILRGLQRAAVVFYLTESVRRQIIRHGLLDTARLVKAPNGVAAEFTPDGPEAHPLPELMGRPYLLHVGSDVPRKRLDVLLDVFAIVCRERPELMLLQVGGDRNVVQQQQISRDGIAERVWRLRGLTRGQLAACYRRAALVLLPSEAEGFGLPTVEALACGTRVVASDIAAFREVGGNAVSYCPVADVANWAGTVERLLDDPTAGPKRDVRLARAARYTWAAQAAAVVEGYRGVGLLSAREAACASST